MSEEKKSYIRNVLFQNDFFEIVSIEWNDKSVSPSHNHGWSQCLVLVEEGTFENRLDLGMKRETQILEAGQVLSTPVGAKHEMACKSKKGKTLHVYTPKIREQKDIGHFRAPTIEGLKSHLKLSKATDISALRQIISEFKEKSISTQSPYFMNQLFSGVLPQMLMAEEFIAQTKTTLATFEASPVFSAIESEVIDALSAKIGWSVDSRSGVSVPGGSAANFMAAHCARQKLFPEAKSKGLGASVFKIFVSEEAHYSFKKAAAVLGVGIDNVVSVSVDEKGRMIADHLEIHIKQCRAEGSVPLMVAATAGTTVLGAFDEIPLVSAICKRNGVWLHVDGAWGGPALFSNKLSHLVDGIALADSVTFDAHKLFGASLTSSFFLTQHADILMQANDVSGGAYLFHSDDPALDRGKLSWQCGRKADAASFWTIWKSLGTEGLGDFVDHLVGLRDEVLPWIKAQERLQLVADPEFLNICVRVHPQGRKDADWSKTVREKLKEQDLAFVNYSANKDGSFLRLILAHPYLTPSHVRQILEWALEVE